MRVIDGIFSNNWEIQQGNWARFKATQFRWRDVYHFFITQQSFCNLKIRGKIKALKQLQKFSRRLQDASQDIEKHSQSFYCILF